MDSTTEIQPPVPVVRRNGWLKVLTTAAVFYVLLLVALLLTKNSNLFPTLAMVGSFMVPVAYVAFIYERRHLSRLAMPTVSLAFIYGGLLGIIAAAFLEPFFIRQLNLGAILRIGLIEEFAKILGVLVIARRRRHDSFTESLSFPGPPQTCGGNKISLRNRTVHAYITHQINVSKISIIIFIDILIILMNA